MWEQAYLYMQDWQGCDQLETEKGIQLKDSRDGNIYTVAKLKDGNCWMTQNLRIQGVTLHTSDSNVTQDFILPSSDQESFNNTDYNKDSVYVNENTGYYSWHAATAGTGNNTIYTGRATSSVCPKGWYLPNEAQYAELIKYYSDGTLGDIPANFLLSGYITNSGVLSEIGTNGYYQTSYTHCSYTANYTLKLTISARSSEERDMRYGNAVRCVTGMGDEPSTASFVDEGGDDDHDDGGTAWGGGTCGR